MQRKKIILGFVILLLIVLAFGCKPKKGDEQKIQEQINTGTQGILISFLPFNPPDKIPSYAKGFDVVVEAKNRGVFPQKTASFDLGHIYLSGYDRNIIYFDRQSAELNEIELQGKSLVNINGGSQLATFKATSINFGAEIEKYEPILLATACYNYETTASASICMDPDPYSFVTQKKVCEAKGTSLGSQGGPIAITSIEQEALGESTRFKINFRNVGNGDVIKKDSLAKCNPYGADKISRGDLDIINLDEIKISEISLECSPFAQEPLINSFGPVRMINGEGSIICEIRMQEYPQYQESKTAFITPLVVKLSYGYRTTAEKKVTIFKSRLS